MSKPDQRLSLSARLNLSGSQFANKRGIYLGRRSTKIHVALYRRTKGKVGGRLPGFPNVPIVLVDHVGAKTGKRRTSPLMYHEDNGVVAVAASKAGEPTHPAWFHNLMAGGPASVEVGTDTFPVTARVTEGAERDRYWSKQKQDYPGFADYEQKTTREIPVVVLERVG